MRRGSSGWGAVAVMVDNDGYGREKGNLLTCKGKNNSEVCGPMRDQGNISRWEDILRTVRESQQGSGGGGGNRPPEEIGREGH